jgi:putative ABC transport system substrate-binding protein
VKKITEQPFSSSACRCERPSETRLRGWACETRTAESVREPGGRVYRIPGGELGHIEGENIAFEFRSAEGKLDRLPELAAELVRLKVDVIVPLYVPSALAAKQATREIPIVIIAADPVETGIVPSLARPGENITGVSLMSAVFVGKCVELFRDMLPAMRRVAVLTNAADALFAKLVLEHVEVAARLSGIKIQPITLRGPDQELDAAFAAMTKEQADAVVIQGSLSTKRLADLPVSIACQRPRARAPLWMRAA